MAENIQICNFNDKHTNLIRVRMIYSTPNNLSR
jgi:hypothetical protein